MYGGDVPHPILVSAKPKRGTTRQKWHASPRPGTYDMLFAEARCPDFAIERGCNEDALTHYNLKGGTFPTASASGTMCVTRPIVAQWAGMSGTFSPSEESPGPCLDARDSPGLVRPNALVRRGCLLHLRYRTRRPGRCRERGGGRGAVREAIWNAGKSER